MRQWAIVIKIRQIRAFLKTLKMRTRSDKQTSDQSRFEIRWSRKQAPTVWKFSKIQRPWLRISWNKIKILSSSPHNQVSEESTNKWVAIQTIWFRRELSPDKSLLGYIRHNQSRQHHWCSPTTVSTTQDTMYWGNNLQGCKNNVNNRVRVRCQTKEPPHQWAIYVDRVSSQALEQVI